MVSDLLFFCSGIASNLKIRFSEVHYKLSEWFQHE